jgi:adenylate cyclase
MAAGAVTDPPATGDQDGRRLIAIVYADMVGYSRLIGIDDEGTIARLLELRRDLIDPALTRHDGTLVNTAGDSLLISFESILSAMRFAVEVQRAIPEYDGDHAADQRIRFRMGVNVGDVISHGTNLHGDGTNIAARLQTVCPSGAICVSRVVRDQVDNRLGLPFKALGAINLKNIRQPVEAFVLHVTPDVAATIAATPRFAPTGGTSPDTHHRRWIGVAVAATVTGVVGAASAWWVMVGPATAPRQATETVPAATRASIAVLPFAPPGDAEKGDRNDYFADGLTEDIISALGRFRDISVISRGGVFAYKGKSPTPAEVGSDLKVRYVLEGSVRRSAERIRVSVSLTDTSRSELLWSEKYDPEPKDIFAVQDQITRRISGALAIRVTSLEVARSAAKPPSNLQAYDLVLRGRDRLSRFSRSDNALARDLFERAIELDPNYASAYIGLGHVDLDSVTEGWTQEPSETLERAESLTRKAVGLDDLSSAAHALLGQIFVHFGDYDRALDELKRAIALNGSDAEAYKGLLSVLLWRGDISGAIAAGEVLVQFDPELSGYSFHLATAYVLADRGADAIRILEPSLDRNRADSEMNIMLAAAYAQAGRQEEAARQADLVRQHFPGSWEGFGALLRDAGQREKLTQELKKVGL